MAFSQFPNSSPCHFFGSQKGGEWTGKKLEGGQKCEHDSRTVDVMVLKCGWEEKGGYLHPGLGRGQLHSRCAGDEGRGAPRARVQAKHFAPPVYLRSEAGGRGAGAWGGGRIVLPPDRQ